MIDIILYNFFIDRIKMDVILFYDVSKPCTSEISKLFNQIDFFSILNI